MSFARGTYGLDSADASTSLDVNLAVSTGAKFWFRYSAGVNNTNPGSQFKLCQVGEIAALAAKGVSVVANFEAAELRPLSGYAAGLADGQADLSFWQSRGYAQGKSIYISLEPGHDVSELAAITQYYAGYSAGLGGYYVADGGYYGVQLLVAAAKAGLIKHGWIPSSASASVDKVSIDPTYAPPAKTNWDLWFPTKSQVTPALAYLDTLVAGAPFESIVWQSGNKWLNNDADEDIVLLGGYLGSQLETPDGSTPPPVVVTPPPAPVAHGPMYGAAVPSLIAKGTGHYFGSIDGPAASLGGYNADEKPYVKLIQQQLIYLGFVPGQTNPNSGWADGIFDVKGGGIGSATHGATSMAVAAFQRKYMPGTQYYGQVWFDDWAKLASF